MEDRQRFRSKFIHLRAENNDTLCSILDLWDDSLTKDKEKVNCVACKRLLKISGE